MSFYDFIGKIQKAIQPVFRKIGRQIQKPIIKDKLKKILDICYTITHPFSK